MAQQTPMPMFLLLFDIDGTLLIGRAGLHKGVMNRAGRDVFHPDFDVDAIDRLGSLDACVIPQILEKLDVTASEAACEEFRQRYFAGLWKAAQEATVLPGVPELLRTLGERQDQYIPGLVTGNYREAARIKLEATGIGFNQFKLGAYGDLDTTRGELVRIAVIEAQEVYKQEFPWSHVVVIGDTLRDIECAHENGCRVIAVPTGWTTREELAAAEPDYLLDDLRDIDRFLACVHDLPT